LPGCKKEIMKAPEKVRTARGFSLVEMMIVIGLIGILSAVGVYAWQGYRDNANLRTAARDVATDIAATKQRAVSEGIQYRITFSTAANNYTIEPGTAAGAPYTIVQTKSPTVFGASLSISSANFGFLGQELRFVPRGTLSAGTVILRNSKGSQATITINVTGRTHVLFAMQ
jgi:prepilin-type N-terminal cleavage/methylation domain-containing protein